MTINEYHVAIVAAICTALPLVLAQIVNFVKVLKRLDASEKRLECKIDEVKDVGRVTNEQIDLIKTGAFRAGHVAGVEHARTTQPAQLE